MDTALALTLDRTIAISLAEQIRSAISAAIENGVLVPGARLPSWRVLAAQLGVARGTVRTAYERLSDAQLIVSSRSAGTRVADRPTRRTPRKPRPGEADALPVVYREFMSGRGLFQMGVPSSELFPVRVLSRIRARTAREEAALPATYPDPRGELALRREIAAHVAIARGIECSAAQVFIAAGFSGALGFVLRVLQPERRSAWVEDPGFPFARQALQIAQVLPVPVPVDSHGMDVTYGLQHAPEAALVLTTPGQQAPLGPTLSLERRLRLLAWAAQSDAWIIEDDYLGELQLKGRAAPALAALDRAGRVVHIGSFSKTISPALRLGFVVVPAGLVQRFGEAAACLGPAPGPAVQQAIAEFMRTGHYMRHLRRLKRVYAARRDALSTLFERNGLRVRSAGVALLLELPRGVRDTALAREALTFGVAPAPLSPWYCSPDKAKSAILLGIATAEGDQLRLSCDRLLRLINSLS